MGVFRVLVRKRDLEFELNFELESFLSITLKSVFLGTLIKLIMLIYQVFFLAQKVSIILAKLNRKKLLVNLAIKCIG